MVTTGFSRIHVARYSSDGQVATYTGCRELARARSMTVSVEAVKENNFYANNILAETEPAMFSSGTLALEVDGLDGEEEALILGLTATGEEDAEEYIFGDNMNPPYLGVGGIARKQMNGVVGYRPCILLKARFAIPEDAAKTQEDQIDWQSQTLNATLMRDDTPAHGWKVIPKSLFATEDEAVAWMVKKLGGMAKKTQTPAHEQEVAR